MQIAFISHTVPGDVFTVGSHYLAREFAAAGWDVAHVSTAYSVLHRFRSENNTKRSCLAASGAVRDASGVLEAVPKVIVPMRFSRNTAVIKRHMIDIGFGAPDYVLVDQPLMSSAVPWGNKTKVVYRATDLYPGGVARSRQTKLLSGVHGLVATSSVVMKNLKAIRQDVPSMIMRNGVDFSQYKDQCIGPRSGAVYVGALDHRFDWDGLRIIAELLAPLPVVVAGPVIGPVPHLGTNVELIGPVDSASVPQLLGKSQFGILPFSNAVENQGRSPMKYYEYLASSLYVLGSCTAELSARNDPGVYLYNSTREIGTLVSRMLSHEGPNHAGRAASQSEDWGGKAQQLQSFLFSLP